MLNSPLYPAYRGWDYVIDWKNQDNKTKKFHFQPHPPSVFHLILYAHIAVKVIIKSFTLHSIVPLFYISTNWVKVEGNSIHSISILKSLTVVFFPQELLYVIQTTSFSYSTEWKWIWRIGIPFVSISNIFQLY